MMDLHIHRWLSSDEESVFVSLQNTMGLYLQPKLSLARISDFESLPDGQSRHSMWMPETRHPGS
jgi:hypothetical protein